MRAGANQGIERMGQLTIANALGQSMATDPFAYRIEEMFSGQVLALQPLYGSWYLGTLKTDLPQGVKPLAAQTPRLHSCYFAPLPGPTIRTGVRALTAVALDFLSK